MALNAMLLPSGDHVGLKTSSTPSITMSLSTPPPGHLKIETAGRPSVSVESASRSPRALQAALDPTYWRLEYRGFPAVSVSVATTLPFSTSATTRSTLKVRSVRYATHRPSGLMAAPTLIEPPSGRAPAICVPIVVGATGGY